MHHYRLKKENNIYIYTGALRCIGASWCIWCICTISGLGYTPLSAQQILKHLITTQEGDTLEYYNTYKWPKKLPAKYQSYAIFRKQFDVRLHNDEIYITFPWEGGLSIRTNVAIYYLPSKAFSDNKKLTAGFSLRTDYRFKPIRDGYYLAIMFKGAESHVLLFEKRNQMFTTYRGYESKSQQRYSYFKTHKN